MRPEPWAFIGTSAARAALNEPREVDGHDAIPVLRTGVLDQLPRVDAGVLDDDVEPAESRERQGDGRFGVGHFRDVGADEGHAEFVGSRLSGSSLAVGEHQAGAFLLEPQRNALADAARGADDQGDLAFQPSGHASLWRNVCLNVSRSTAASTRNPWMTWVKLAGRPIRLIAVLIDESSSTPA